jgi:8-oxo-dGTP diphosphatase
MSEQQRREDLRTLLREGQSEYLPHISVDSVIFSFHDDRLKVLLLRMKDQPRYALPGGYVRREESLDEAAHRILEERTGLSDVYLEQFGTFGENFRTGRDRGKALLEALGADAEDGSWILQRFISVAYYALVNYAVARPRAGFFDSEYRWAPVGELPELIFDHAQIIRKAQETLRVMLDHKLVGSNLLPETFTMNELQHLCEAILGRPLLRANFQRKMLSLDILERLEKRFGGGAHKAPYLYRFQAGNDIQQAGNNNQNGSLAHQAAARQVQAPDEI